MTCVTLCHAESRKREQGADRGRAARHRHGLRHGTPARAATLYIAAALRWDDLDPAGLRLQSCNQADRPTSNLYSNFSRLVMVLWLLRRRAWAAARAAARRRWWQASRAQWASSRWAHLGCDSRQPCQAKPCELITAVASHCCLLSANDYRKLCLCTMIAGSIPP